MQIFTNNLGPLKAAKWTPSNLNVIAGPNGSGKTYLAHAIYSILKGISIDAAWRFRPKYSDSITEISQQLIKDKTIQLHGSEIVAVLKPLIEDKAIQSTRAFVNYLGENPHNNLHPKVSVELEENSIDTAFFNSNRKFKHSFISNTYDSVDCTLTISSAEQTAALVIEPVREVSEEVTGDSTFNPSLEDISFLVSSLLEQAYASANLVPYILSAERTGISLFQQDIDFGCSRMVEEFRIEGSEALNGVPRATWSPAVEDNFNNFRSLNRTRKNESFIVQQHPDILELFNLMVSGKFVESEGEFKFMPSGTKNPIPMASTSSTVRSLFELGIFLNHIARKGQWLLIDEPELNLHPKNQVLMGRLLAAMSNAGLKILVTTHSDYIVRELSILIMLSEQDKSGWPNGYLPEYLLSPEDIRVDYTDFQNGAHLSELNSAEVTAEEGIAAPFFDETIQQQNENLEKVLWG